MTHRHPSQLAEQVDGTIAEINEELIAEPEWLNAEPYGQGWIVNVTLSSAAGLDGLLTAAEYQELTEE
ncbi:hypothetical protein BIV25_45410 [Streptomyces sp. MUSC 14]|uniref:glycine cleavage system protein H n=1 Tax=Streptomyces sp. MUSC 14 TaxID=1354889 RepID=UPI0008F5A4CB|nr:hypothetical protein [Streptomyces sp. MUSC 14]OIJ84925.1 hypothetical protein BIV25_45410 [Streptomyces sp. MUSC 14]